MDSIPRVAVCIPLYNSQQYVSVAIESVLNQTLTELELILSDDLSNDSTLKICKQFAEIDNRVKICPNTNHVGLFRNFNRSIQASSAPYVKLLCHDDVLEPDALEKMVSVLDLDRTITLVACSRNIIDNEGRCVRVISPYQQTGRIPGSEAIKDTLLAMDNNIADPSSVCFRRIDGVDAFNSSYTYFNLALWCRLLSHGDFFYIKEPLCGQRVHETQTSVAITESLVFLADYLLAREDLRQLALDVGISESKWDSIIRQRILDNALYMIETQDIGPRKSQAALEQLLRTTDEELLRTFFLRVAETLQWLLMEVVCPTRKPLHRDPVCDQPHEVTSNQSTSGTDSSEALFHTHKPAEVPSLKHAEYANDAAIRLNLGCGHDLKPGYINIDLFCEGPGITRMDMRCLALPDNYADEIFSNHSLEHIPHTETLVVLKEWRRVLKPNGLLHIKVPDLEWCAKKWLTLPEEDRWGYYLATLFGLQADAGQVHYTSFTHARLRNLLQCTGFKDIETKSYWMPSQQCIEASCRKQLMVVQGASAVQAPYLLGLNRKVSGTSQLFATPLPGVQYDWIMDEIRKQTSTGLLQTESTVCTLPEEQLACLSGQRDPCEQLQKSLEAHIKHVEAKHNVHKPGWHRLLSIPPARLLYELWRKIKFT